MNNDQLKAIEEYVLACGGDDCHICSGCPGCDKECFAYFVKELIKLIESDLFNKKVKESS